MEDIDFIFKESLKGSNSSISIEKNEYWHRKSTKRKRSFIFFIFLPIKLIRLTICFLFWILSNNFYSLFRKNNKFILLTRSKGIRDINSLEDYRFKGLEKELSKYGKVCFYIHGNIKKFNLSFAPRFYDEDFNYLAEFITFGFGFKNLKFNYVWQEDLEVNKLKAKLISIFFSKNDKIFFWDFNRQHCSLCLAGYLKNCRLFGSMHAFTEKGNLPWIENSWNLSQIIKHTFINYYSIFKTHEVEVYAKNLKKKATFYMNKMPNKLIILEENFSIDKNGSKRFYHIEWAIKNKKFFKEIYIKKRPDNAFTKIFINESKRFGLKDFILIDNIKKINNLNDALVIGSSSSYLLELSSKKILCLSISNKELPPFSNPSWQFHKVFDESLLDENYQIANPIYISTAQSFANLLKKGIQVIPSNASLNHLSFRKFVVQTIVKEMLK